MNKCGGNGAFAIRDEADALDPDLGAIIEETRDGLFIDQAAVVFLQHRVAIMAAVIAGARQGHVDGDGRDAFAALPGTHPVIVPGNLGPVQNQLLDMFGHSTHVFAFSFACSCSCSFSFSSMRRILLKSFFSSQKSSRRGIAFRPHHPFQRQGHFRRLAWMAQAVAKTDGHSIGILALLQPARHPPVSQGRKPCPDDGCSWPASPRVPLVSVLPMLRLRAGVRRSSLIRLVTR